MTQEGIEKLGMEYSRIWGGCIAATFFLGPLFYFARVGEEYYRIDYDELDAKMSEIEEDNARIDSEIQKYKDSVGFDKIKERIEELKEKIKRGKDVYTSPNELSEPLLKKILKTLERDGIEVDVHEMGSFSFGEKTWKNLAISRV